MIQFAFYEHAKKVIVVLPFVKRNKKTRACEMINGGIDCLIYKRSFIC